MGPKFGVQKGNKLGSQLGPMSITKLSPNWACQMGPIHCPKFLLSGPSGSRYRARHWRMTTTYFTTTPLVILLCSLFDSFRYYFFSRWSFLRTGVMWWCFKIGVLDF